MNQISCEKCDGKLKEIKEDVPFKSKVLGNILVPGVRHFKCAKCNGSLISYEGASVIFKYVREKEAEAISSLPIGEFVSLNQAAHILGVSKQAFSKNPHIKRGYILSAIIDGKKLYYKRSVELYREKNDGRFLIKNEINPIQVKYIVINTMTPSAYDMPSDLDILVPDIYPWQPHQYDVGIKHKYHSINN